MPYADIFQKCDELLRKRAAKPSPSPAKKTVDDLADLEAIALQSASPLARWWGPQIGPLVEMTPDEWRQLWAPKESGWQVPKNQGIRP